MKKSLCVLLTSLALCTAAPVFATDATPATPHKTVLKNNASSHCTTAFKKKCAQNLSGNSSGSRY